MGYFFVFLCLLITCFIYFKTAVHHNIIDKPNERSSHNYLTIRGGGIIFPVAAFIWFFVSGFDHILGISGLLLIALISFLDDLYGMPRNIRMFLHFLAVTLLFFELSFYSIPWYFWIIGYIFMIGWINAFNFMDGINGMTVFYSMVCLATFLTIAEEIRFVSVDLILILSMSVLIFAFFNVRKRALAFAGDVGSVSMAFLLGGMMSSLILNTGRFEYMLFFAVYAADSGFTIVHRLIRRENIFKAHRYHLYQYLSNELEMSHILVSLSYAGIQIIINIITIQLIASDIMDMGLFMLASVFISLVYLSVRLFVLKVAANRIER